MFGLLPGQACWQAPLLPRPFHQPEIPAFMTQNTSQQRTVTPWWRSINRRSCFLLFPRWNAPYSLETAIVQGQSWEMLVCPCAGGRGVLLRSQKHWAWESSQERIQEKTVSERRSFRYGYRAHPPILIRPCIWMSEYVKLRKTTGQNKPPSSTSQVLCEAPVSWKRVQIPKK